MSSSNELNLTAQLIKGAFISAMAAQGKSIKQAEEAIINRDEESLVTLSKIAMGLGDIVPLLSAGMQLGGSGALIAGGLLGGAGYGAYAGVADSRRKVEQAEAIKARLDIARQELETELALRQGHGAQ